MKVVRTLAALAAVAAAATLGVAGLARAQDKPARAARGLAGVGLTQPQVDAAVEKAKQFLLKALVSDNSGGEIPADQPVALGSDDLLAAFALSHTDAFAKDKALARRVVQGLYQRDIGKTYDTGCLLMTLEHLGGRIHKERVADAVQVLIDKQNKDEGGWSYSDTMEAPSRTPPPLPADAVIEVTGGVPIQAKVPSAAKLKQRGDGTNWNCDLSTSQFGALGIHSGFVQGVDVVDEVWELALKKFTSTQRDDGGWAYNDASEESGSMTCAGITGVTLALSHLGKDPAQDDRVKRGLAWLAKHFGFEGNPYLKEDGHTELEQHHYYFVYGIERVGVLLGTEFVGDHEWYPEGAKYLLAHQAADGSWSEDDNAVQGTAFALLFLTRATTPLAAPKGGSGTLRTAVSGPAEAQAAEKTGLYFILDASDSMNDKIGGRSKWEIVKEAAKKIIAKLPDDALVGLRVYGHNPSNPRKVDERETELLMPVAKLDRAKFNQIVDGVKPQGRTPIAMSFDRTSTDLASSPACRVLLLSDGAETGGGDPVASAKGLIANAKCLGIDCLGFDIVSEPRARAQLQEVARIGKGRYTESQDPEVLARAGARTGAEYVLTDPAGKELARGTLGDERPLPEGEYRIRVTVNEKPCEATLWMNTGVETRAVVHPERAK